MAQHRRYLKRRLNPDHYVFIYWGGDKPNYWYVRIGGLETPRFRHGIALAQSFEKEEDAKKYKQDVIEYLEKAFKINWIKN